MRGKRSKRLTDWLGRIAGSEFWCKLHQSTDPTCLVTAVQTVVNVMVWEICCWHTLGLLVLFGHCLNTTAYCSIVSDHVYPFMTTVVRILLALAMSSLWLNGLHGHQISNRAPVGFYGTRDSHHGYVTMGHLSCQHGPKSKKIFFHLTYLIYEKEN